MSLFALALACRQPTPDPVDTSDFETSAQAGWAWTTAFFPGFLPLYLASWAASEGECPSVATTTEGVWEADGECSADGRDYYGTGDGTGLFSESPPLRTSFSATWAGFGWYLGDSGTILATGDEVSTGSSALGNLVADGLVVEGSAHGTDYEIGYQTYTLTNFSGFAGDRTEWQLDSEVTADLQGSPEEQTISATGSYTEGCTTEFGSGSLTVTGNDHFVEFTFDGATNCDACIPWETDSGLADAICFASE